MQISNINLKKIDEKIIYLSIIMWTVLAVYILVFILLKSDPYKHTVTKYYWNAAYNWIIGQQLTKTGTGSAAFLYFPQSAILQIPFALIPFRLAELIWRILNISLLILSCHYLIKLFNNNFLKNICFFFTSVLTIALSYDAIRNGQLNVILGVLSVFAAYNLSNKRFKTCIILCLFGTALKPYMAIPLLLIVALYPKRTLVTAVIGIIIFIFFPFICQNPHYVITQYKNTFTVLEAVKEVGLSKYWADIFGLIKFFNINLNQNSINLICFLAGVAVYLPSLIFFRKRKTTGGIIIMFLAVSYCLLFSQRTEMNTYCMAGPFMGVLIFTAFFFENNYSKYSYIIISLICWFFIFAANALATPIAEYLGTEENTLTAPLAFTVFLCYTLIYVIPKINTDKFEQKLAMQK